MDNHENEIMNDEILQDPVVIPEEPETEEVENDEEEGTENVSSDNSGYRYRLTNRGTQGVRSIKLREGDRVVAAIQIEAECAQDLLLMSCQGQVVRIPIAQIRRCSRNSQGVILMRMAKSGDSVANVSVVDELSEADSAANAAKQEEEESIAANAAEFQARQDAENAALAQAEAEAQAKIEEALENGEFPESPEE